MKIRFFLSSIMMLTVFMILASAQPLGSRKPVTVNNMVTLEARNLPANGMEYDRILPDGTRVDWTTNFPKRKILIITDVEGIIKGALPPIAAQTLFELELVNPGVIPPGGSTVFKIDLTHRLVDGSTATLSNFLGGFQ